MCNLDNKYYVNYRGSECKFIPLIKKDIKELPNLVKGKVLFIDKGEYNPLGWYKELTINKKEIKERKINF